MHHEKLLKDKLFELFLKLGLSLAALTIAFIPTWIFLIIKYIANPEGFWQKLVLFGLGLWVGGGIQFFLAVLFVVALIVIWKEL